MQHKRKAFMMGVVLLVVSSFAAQAIAGSRRGDRRPAKIRAAEGERQDSYGPWGASLRFGPAIPTQDFSTGTGGSAGFLINPQLIYDINNSLSVGFDFSWENHGVDVAGTGIGSLTTYSLMPFAQYRFVESGHLRPYGALAAGFNINTFGVDPAFVGATLTPGNSIAIRPSIGLDWFVWRSLVVNTEVGWKWNSGSYSSNFIAGGDFNASSVHLFFGARYF